MRQLIVILQTAVFVGITYLACAQSLADLANKEKERREEIENGTKVITNAEVANYRNGAVTTGPAIPAASTETDIENGGEGQSSSTEADSEEAGKLLAHNDGRGSPEGKGTRKPGGRHRFEVDRPSDAVLQH
jgi:hypothetical protein